MVMHDNKLKQKKIKFTCRPRIKLNHNVHVYINTQLFQERLSEKIVHATILKGNMGYDQHTVSDTVAVKPTFAVFF